MPIFQFKQDLVDPVDLHGVLRIRWASQDRVFVSTYLTQIDQAFVVWGVVTAAIFFIAQFFVLRWTVQAVIWSALSVAAILLSGRLSWFWVSTKRRRWILYTWSLLILIGLGLSAYGVFVGVGVILSNLCSLWLGICALGYFATSIGLRAPALFLMGFVHVGTIPALALLPSWQFLLTGVTMSGCLFCLAALQWQHQ